jgi:hypothetical protein
MKKQNLNLLKLKKNTISNFNSEEINGGVISGIGCGVSNNCIPSEPTSMCDRTIINCPVLTYTCYLTSYCRTQAAC